MIPKDINSFGKPVISVIGLNRDMRISIAPDERNTVTAIIRPINDGSIPITVFSPSSAPSMNVENISTLEHIPHYIMMTNIRGSII